MSVNGRKWRGRLVGLGGVQISSHQQYGVSISTGKPSNLGAFWFFRFGKCFLDLKVDLDHG